MIPEVGQWIATHGENHGVGKVTSVNLKTKEITATFSPFYDPGNKMSEKTVKLSEVAEVVIDQDLIQECEASIQK